MRRMIKWAYTHLNFDNVDAVVFLKKIAYAGPFNLIMTMWNSQYEIKNKNKQKTRF